MRITITSKNQEKTFDDADGNVINIGNSNRCHFKLDIGEPLLLSLQKNENGNNRREPNIQIFGLRYSKE